MDAVERNRAAALNAARAAARCGAQTRKGEPCKGPAVAGKTRCRMHGGGVAKSGRGSGAPKRNRNALKHGLYALMVLKERQMMLQLVKEAKKVVKGLGGR